MNMPEKSKILTSLVLIIASWTGGYIHAQAGNKAPPPQGPYRTLQDTGVQQAMNPDMYGTHGYAMTPEQKEYQKKQFEEWTKYQARMKKQQEEARKNWEKQNELQIQQRKEAQQQWQNQQEQARAQWQAQNQAMLKHREQAQKNWLKEKAEREEQARKYWQTQNEAMMKHRETAQKNWQQHQEEMQKYRDAQPRYPVPVPRQGNQSQGYQSWQENIEQQRARRKQLEQDWQKRRKEWQQRQQDYAKQREQTFMQYPPVQPYPYQARPVPAPVYPGNNYARYPAPWYNRGYSYGPRW